MAKKKKKAKKASKKRSKKTSKKRAKKTVAHHHKAHVAAGMSYNKRAEEWIKANEVLSRAKKRRGKRWVCGGPVRTGCGGSSSRVIGKVR